MLENSRADMEAEEAKKKEEAKKAAEEAGETYIDDEDFYADLM